MQNNQKTNTCAVVGFVLSFFFGLIGTIVCIVALTQIKKRGEKGKGFAIAGIIIGSLGLVTVLAVSLFFFLLVAPGLNNSIESQTVCANGPNYYTGYYGSTGYIYCGSQDYDGEYVCEYTNGDGDVVTAYCSSN